MKHLNILLVLLLSSLTLEAQVLKGKIYEGLEEHGLKNVRLSIYGFTESRSDDFGRFSIELPGKKRGSLVKIDLIKEGYVVINREALRPRIPDSDEEEILIYMCPTAQRNKLALRHYKIQVQENIDRNYQAEAKVLADNMNYEAIAELTQKKKVAENMVDSLAQRLATFDPNRASDELTRAMQLYQAGEIDAALSAIDTKKIIARLSARREIVEKMKAANEEDIMSLIYAAEMAVTALKFDQAEIFLENAVQADTTNFRIIKLYSLFAHKQKKTDKLIPYIELMLRQSKTKMDSAISLNLLGITLKNQNQHPQAIAILQTSLGLIKKLSRTDPQNYKAHLALVIDNLGNAYYEIGRFKEAISSHKESVRIREELLPRIGLAAMSS
ncbi:MAG: tetratricopeptide repeat protein, partial [Bacteroidota bacterium]